MGFTDHHVASQRWRKRLSGKALLGRGLFPASTFQGELLETRHLLTTFYVDTNNPAASDRNPGISLTAPLKTIGQALTLSQNNNATSQSDTILIRGGVYHEQPFIWSSNSGASPADRTIISAYVNPTTGTYEPVYIDAADATTGTWIRDGTSNRWYLSNFTTETSGVWVDWSPSNDGASLQQIGGYGVPYFDTTRTEVGSGISDMYPGTYYGDLADSRLYVWLADGSNPNLHTIEYANRGREIYEPGTAVAGGYSYVNYISFIGLKLRHDNVYDSAGQDPGCAMYTEGDQQLINCDIQWNAGVGVFLRGTSQMINCISSNNGSNGVQPQGNGFVINGGQFDGNYWRHYTDGGQAAIKVVTNSPTLFGNIINIEASDNYGKGIWFDTCFENSVVSQITGNYIHDNQGTGIDLEASRNYYVANNIIAGNTEDGILLNAVENADIYNNTIVGNYGVGAIELDGGTRDQGSTYPGTTGMLNNSIRNNIIANNFTDYDLDVPTIAEPSAEVNNNTSDYNLFYRRGGPLKFTDGGTYDGWGSTPSTLAGWQNVSGQDAHSMVADPLFLAGGSGMQAYQLGSNSPARYVAAPVSPGVTDLGALPYTSGGTGTPGPIIINTDPAVWVDDQLPDKAAMTAPDESGNVGQNRFWLWNSSNAYSGAASLDSTVVAGTHRQYFTGANPRAVGNNDILFAYVWIDPVNTPSQMMLEWQDSAGTWSHLAYWGQNLIGGGLDGSTDLTYMGSLPAAGQWVRLAVPASSVGLADESITGFSFDLYNGRALLDKIGNTANSAVLSGVVFEDDNGNGIEDAGEPGLAGRTVYLDLNNNGVLDAGEPTATTDSTGAYSFSGLAEGTYVVRQQLPAGDVASTAGGSAYSVQLVAGTTTTQAFGEFPTDLYAASDGENYTAALSSDGSRLQVWENASESSLPTYSVSAAQLSQFTIHTGVYDSSVTIDCSNGVPTGFHYDGGAALGTLSILGSPNVSNLFLLNSDSININGLPITFANPASISIAGGSANDVLTQLASMPPVSFVGGGGNDVLNIDAGTFSFTGDPGLETSSLTLNVAGAVSFAAGNPGSGINAFHLAGLNISSGGTVTVQQAVDTADRSVLIVGSLAVQGVLDLSNNDMIVRSGDLPDIQSDLATGYDSGTWAGTSGIVSSAAASDPAHLTALGFLSGLAMPFDGQSVSIADVLVKYTYYGDANLDGRVDGSDYSRVDFGILAQTTGWMNGDFNYDNTIDGSDYTLLDNAYNRQGTALAAEVVGGDQLASRTRPPSPRVMSIESGIDGFPMPPAGVEVSSLDEGSSDSQDDNPHKKKPRTLVRGSALQIEIQPRSGKFILPRAQQAV